MQIYQLLHTADLVEKLVDHLEIGEKTAWTDIYNPL